MEEKQMVADLIEIFDEEYDKRRLITPQNTAEKLTAKGYRKASEVAAEIIGEIEKVNNLFCTALGSVAIARTLADLKKKYTEEGDTNDAKDD